MFRTIASFFLLLSVASYPFYVFPSGSIQPAHAFLLIFSIFELLVKKTRSEAWIVALLGLAAWSFLVDLVYDAHFGSRIGFDNSAYFFYNFLISLAIYKYSREAGIRPLKYGILIAAVVATGTVLHSGVDLKSLGEEGRETGTFNNPNQLGYFSVCLLSITYLLYRCNYFAYAYAAVLVVVSLFLAVVSLSKAAIIANCAVVLFTLQPMISRKMALTIVLLSLVLAGGAYLSLSSGMFDEYLFVRRIQNMGQERDSSLIERGYFLFLEGNELTFLFGLGAQNVRDILGHEIHSTFASIFTEYGAVGLFIIAVVIFSWAIRVYWAFGIMGLVSLLAPSILYGITHNGVRFTLFWILFAASIGMATTQMEYIRRLAHPHRPISPTPPYR